MMLCSIAPTPLLVLATYSWSSSSSRVDMPCPHIVDLLHLLLPLIWASLYDPNVMKCCTMNFPSPSDWLLFHPLMWVLYSSPFHRMVAKLWKGVDKMYSRIRWSLHHSLVVFMAAYFSQPFHTWIQNPSVYLETWKFSPQAKCTGSVLHSSRWEL